MTGVGKKYYKYWSYYLIILFSVIKVKCFVVRDLEDIHLSIDTKNTKNLPAEVQ